MKKENVLTHKNGMEYNSPMSGNFSQLFLIKDITNYYMSQVSIHWHQEVEFLLIISGEMECQINEFCFLLQTGDGIFINANALHTLRSIRKQNCQYYTLRLNPFMLANSTDCTIYNTYISPILYCTRLPYPLSHKKTEYTI